MKEIRKAEKRDISKIAELLYQVEEIHRKLRPDIFRSGARKYDDKELEKLLDDENTPVFVFVEDGNVLGHAFCSVKEKKNDPLINDMKMLYIDDICVDEAARGKHVGTELFEYIKKYASDVGCYNITLNVWNGNDAAFEFYKKLGMSIQRTYMELIL